MKKQFIYLILAFLFTVSNVSFGHSHYQLDNGGVVVVVAGKKSNWSLDFVVPENYVDKSGSLVVPMQISISALGESPFYVTESTNLMVEIPNLKLEGKYEVTLTIGKHTETIEISI